MTVETELDYLVQADNIQFTASQKTSAINAALSYISGVKGSEIASGDSNNTDRAAALLAQAKLYNDRNARAAKTDQTIQPKTIDQLWTDEMELLLYRDNPLGESKYVQNNYITSADDHWSSRHT